MALGNALFKKEGEVLPEQLLRASAAEYSNVFGIALLDKDGLAVMTKDKAPDLTWLEKQQQKYKDSAMMLYMGEYPEGHLEEDIQPFVLVTDKDKEPIVAAVLEGDFTNHKTAKSNHSPAYHAAEHLRELLTEMYDDCNQNATELLREMRSALFKRQCLKLGIGDKNFVIFMHQNGDLVDHSQAAVKHFDFGFAVDDCDFGTAKGKPEAASDTSEPPKKKGKFDDDDDADTAPVVAAPPKKAAADATRKPVKPPADCQTKAQIRTWYEDNNEDENPMTKLGVVPEGYSKARVAVFILDEPRSVTAARKAKEAPQAKAKETTKSFQEMGEKLRDDTMVAPQLPILSKENKDLNQRMLEKWAEEGILPQMVEGKLLDANNKEIEINTSQINKEEKKHGSYMEQCGYGDEGLDLLSTLPYEGFLQMAKESPEGIALLAFNLRNARLLEIAKRPPRLKVVSDDEDDLKSRKAS